MLRPGVTIYHMEQKNRCQECGKAVAIVEDRRRRKYCSNACRQRAYRNRNSVVEYAKCGFCGGYFVKGSWGGKYCSNAHKQAAYRVRLDNRNSRS